LTDTAALSKAFLSLAALNTAVFVFVSRTLCSNARRVWGANILLLLFLDSFQ
jgi:hypothetical protein